MSGVELPHGFRLLELDEVTSTNDVARRLADEGEPSGLIVLADQQTAGRGRQGRAWQSPPGNLYTSLILRPSRPLAGTASLSLVAGLALAQTIEQLSGGRLEPRLKWPNDVQIGGAKVAGILLEAASDGRGGCVWLVVGIGVNVTSAPGLEVPYSVSHLAACGLDVAPRSLLLALAGNLRPMLDRWEGDGFEPLRESWLARASGAGMLVGLTLGGRVVRGRLLDVDGTGALRLEHASGEAERFAAGEVVFG